MWYHQNHYSRLHSCGKAVTRGAHELAKDLSGHHVCFLRNISRLFYEASAHKRRCSTDNTTRPRGGPLSVSNSSALPGAKPTSGKVGTVERVPTVRVEFAIARDSIQLARLLATGLRPNHPWQEPAIFIDEAEIAVSDDGANEGRMILTARQGDPRIGRAPGRSLDGGR